MKWIKLLIFQLVFGMALVPIFALATSNPDSTPTISNIKANRYLIESGDVLIYGEYDIPYASLPDESAADTYIFRLLDIDGSTELGAVAPFPLFDNGYNEGVFGFYFSASDNLTWGEAYTVRISQNPANGSGTQNHSGNEDA